MKKIYLTILTLSMVSCMEIPKSVDVKDNTKSNPLKVDKLMDEVNHGLYKVKIDDSTTVLIYRGVESCTMLQLK